MDNTSYQIVSVYHKHANCDSNVDQWSRKFVHGLNPLYLRENGFSNESELLSHFLNWLKSFDIVCMYANNPAKERSFLRNYEIRDCFLPQWAKRINMPYHVVSDRFKELNVPILNVHCNGYIHSSYKAPPPAHAATENQVAKALHGVHCSLYDSFELYLYHLLQTKWL